MARKMKDSGIEWIGEIPEDWETIRVKNLFDVSRGRVISKLETTDEGKYPVYSSQTENDGIFGYIDTFDYSGEALTWTTDGEKAGTVFYRNGKYNCTNICGILQKKQDSIYKTDIKYLFYAIRMVAEENKRPDTNGHKIMSNEMEKLSIPITNYDEQVKIGLTLDEKSRNIDNTLNLIKEEIESLENYKKSLITEAVTKGLDKNVEMKDSGIEWIGQIPKHWSVKQLKYVMNNLNYQRVPVDASKRNKTSENLYDYYGATGVIDKIDGYTTVGRNILIGEDGANLIFRNLPLIYIAEGKYWVNNHAHILHPKYGNLDFFAYQMEIIDYRNYITGAAQPKLNLENLKKVKLVCPIQKDQDKIANYLDKKTKLIDQTISLKQKQLQSLEEYKKSLIYEYVTGKKEV